MKDPYRVVIKPLVTEKNTGLKEKTGTVVFEVAAGANKIEIKQAVEKIYGVRVRSIRTVQMWGKKRRLGRYQGIRSDWRKAFVTLKEGEKPIEYFE